MKKIVIPFLLSFALASCGGSVVSSTSASQSSSSQDPGSSSASESSQSSSSSSSTSIPGEGIKLQDAPTATGETGAYYQLLVYSFADGNGDGIGDFKGIVDHLDYIKGLGASSIWLSPIHPCASYHAYDVIDYESINSTYEVTVSGTKYDLAYLLDAAHNKGIKIIMDMVLNHSSNRCEWYTSSHRDWYNSDSQFGGSMPEFNYDKSEVRAKMKEICGNYIKKGVDGFRLDAAYWIYNSGSDRDEKNYAWWNEFCSAMKAIDSDAYIIGEVLDDDTSIMARYNKAGFDDFDFAGKGYLYRTVINQQASALAPYAQNYHSTITGYRSDAIPTHVISNHDVGRFAHEYYGSSSYETNAYNRLALANTLNILLPGNAYIYYGDELGLVGKCPQGWEDMTYRTPMPFSSGRTNSQTYFASFHGDGQTSSITYSGKSADEDAASSSSLYALTKEAIDIKNAVSDLKYGKPTSNYSPFPGLGSFKVGNTSTVLYNANDATLDITLSAAPNARYGIIPSGTASAEGNVLHLPSCATIVLDGDYSIEKVMGGSEAIIPLDDGTTVTTEVSGSLTLHYKNTDSWNTVTCYAWVNNTQYLGAWPGKTMTKGDDGYWTITIDHGASNVIFSNNGNDQTKDLHRNEAGEYWYANGHWYAQKV